MDVGRFMLVFLHSLVWGWRTVMFQLPAYALGLLGSVCNGVLGAGVCVLSVGRAPVFIPRGMV